MKKRAMKKWIPKATPYCEKCKWRSIYSNKPYQENGYCKYTGHGDWQDDGMGLIWDGSKECGEHETKYRKAYRLLSKAKKMKAIITDSQYELKTICDKLSGKPVFDRDLKPSVINPFEIN